MWTLKDPFFFVSTLSYLFKNEMSDLLLRALGHCPFHHYIHWWCDFTPCSDLSWSSFIFVCSLFHYHPCYCFWFIPFFSPLCSFLIVTINPPFCPLKRCDTRCLPILLSTRCHPLVVRWHLYIVSFSKPPSGTLYWGTHSNPHCDLSHPSSLG